MIWGCMTSKGVGYSCKIDSTMDQHLYKSILEDELMQTIEFYELKEEKIIFQHDNEIHCQKCQRMVGKSRI